MNRPRTSPYRTPSLPTQSRETIPWSVILKSIGAFLLLVAIGGAEAAYKNLDELRSNVQLVPTESAFIHTSTGYHTWSWNWRWYVSDRFCPYSEAPIYTQRVWSEYRRLRFEAREWRELPHFFYANPTPWPHPEQLPTYAPPRLDAELRSLRIHDCQSFAEKYHVEYWRGFRNVVGTSPRSSTNTFSRREIACSVLISSSPRTNEEFLLAFLRNTRSIDKKS